MDTSGNATYLVNHPSQVYEWVDISNFDDSNAVQLQHSAYTYVGFVRVNLVENDFDFSAIGFYYTSPNNTYYINPADKSLNLLDYAGYEVLTCTVKTKNYEPKPKLCCELFNRS